ncbi:hypothetical protein L1987_60507 [Smallanthus sonchifolius]|uniref:Uncharacterized protein n=1 Tax=Smallanthus sonchifolius TaxID=185202 RepID=A0ACB9D956_9ASTR|nr:hypothetical protein L1987_60507 [Smallanthus sonchifolius]
MKQLKGRSRRYHHLCSIVHQEALLTMEDEPRLSLAVKATLCLGSETHSIKACKGILSEQLVFVKGESMNILKEFITKHNVPNDVPDEISSEDDDDGEGPAVVSKKKLEYIPRTFVIWFQHFHLQKIVLEYWSIPGY